jgi:hypothetical protein
MIHRPWIQSLLAVLFLAVGAQAQTNLIRNGGFDQKDLSEYYLRSSRDYKDHKLLDSHGGVFTEVIPGNQCYRIDLDRFVTDKQGRKTMNSILAIGGGKGYDLQDGRKAMEVEPNTTYAFSVEMRGTVHKAGFAVTLYHGKDVGYDSFTTAKPTPGGVNIGMDWVAYHGTFKTGPDTNRATLRIGIYTSEQYGLTVDPGMYLLVDTVVIQKKAAPLAALNGTAPADAAPVKAPRVAAAPLSDSAPKMDGQLEDSPWQSIDWQDGFRQLKKDAPATTQTRFKLLAGQKGLYVAVQCDEPTPDKMRLKATKDGQDVYADDCIEFFVDNGQKSLPIHQFIVNANGVRQMTWGRSAKKAQASDYQAWSAATARTAKGWTVEMELPWGTLGLKGRPSAGESLRFNVCRDRYAGTTEHSSWSFSGGNFGDASHFAVLAMGNLADNMQQRLSEARKALASGKTSGGEAVVWADLEGKLNELAGTVKGRMTAAQWQAAFTELEKIQKKIDVAPLGSKPFIVTQVSPTARFTIPFVPEKLPAKTEPIELHAAINEFESLPVAITNLTDRTESYRVVLFGSVDNGIEVAGLKGSADEAFPPDQIHEFEAIRVKDGDSADAGQQFDPLAPMGIARIVTVPPRESGIAWFTFDCRNIKPGKYTGTLRVIPLSEPGEYKLKKGWQYHGSMEDVPVSLEVWPITLSRRPAQTVWLMDAAPNLAFFKDLEEHGNTILQISPWGFSAKFDAQGNITESKADGVLKNLRQCQEWSKTLKLEQPPRQIIAFSAYRTAYNQWMGKKFKVGSEQWERALTQWLQFVEKTMSAGGLAPGSYDVELWDEPKLPDQEEVVASLRVARQACPKMVLNVTLGASRQKPGQIMEMAQYANSFCFWGAYWSDPVYTKTMESLRQAGKGIWFYNCDTNLRVELYGYYRLHAWKGWVQQVDCVGLFDYMGGPGGFYGAGSWKTTPAGALVYNAGNRPVGSIRYEALREGIEDVKYLAALRDAIKSTTADAATVKEAKAFLDSTPARVVGALSHDATQADLARQKAAELIMRLK